MVESLTKLKNEITRSIMLSTQNSSVTDRLHHKSKLKGNKQVVESVDKLLALDLDDYDEKLWQEIKELLKSKGR